MEQDRAALILSLTPMPRLDHEPTQKLILGLGSEERASLAHLLGCSACQQFAERELISEPGSALQAPEGTDEDTWDEAFERQSDTLPRLFSLVREDRQQAERLLDELLRLRPVERRGAVRWRKELRRASLAELLLARAKDELHWRPTDAAELAGLALSVAARVPAPDRLGRGRAAATLAACLLGEARRRLGQMRGAERVLQRAAVEVETALDDELRAYLSLALGKLRWQQRRTDEAAALFVRAGKIYSVYGDGPSEGACSALLGFLALEADEPERAQGPLRRAVRLLEAEVEPDLVVRATLALAFCHADEGQQAEAARLLSLGRQLRSRHGGAGRHSSEGSLLDRGEEVAAAWWEARISPRLGDRETGLSLLDSVRQRLLAEGSLVEAALATLDLAVLRIASRKGSGIALGSDLRRAFPEGPPNLANDIDELEKLPRDEVAEAADRLQRRLLGLQRVRGDRPRLIAHVRDLVDPPVI